MGCAIFGLMRSRRTPSGTRVRTLDEIRTNIAPVLAEYGVERAEVFGSFAHGHADSDSDIDLVVTLKKPVGLLTFFELNNRLEDMLGRKVDLATPSSLNRHLMDRIKNDLVVIY